MHPASSTVRRRWVFMGWGLVVAVIVCSLVPLPPFPATSFHMGALPPDKVAHGFIYTLLMLWFVQIHPKRRWIRIALSFFMLGATLEFLQGLTKYRCFSYGDMGANILGLLIGWGLSLAGLSTLLLRLEQRLALYQYGRPDKIG
jgi:hypothetical protein